MEHRACERTVVASGEDFAESLLVMWRTEQVDKRWKIRGHDLDPTGHRLQEHKAKALPGQLRRHEYVRRTQEGDLSLVIDRSKTAAPGWQRTASLTSDDQLE